MYEIYLVINKLSYFGIYNSFLIGMNALIGISIFTAFIYGILIDGTYFKIYFIVLAIYYLCTQIGTSKYNTPRTKINIATWTSIYLIYP